MKRKIVKQAGKAYTITLPINWIRERGLKEGDEVDVLDRERDLLISSEKSAVLTSLSTSIRGFPERMSSAHLAACYASGVDDLNLDVDKNSYPDLDEYMGFIVVDQKDDFVKIQDINSSTHEDINLIFKRTFQMLLRYYDAATNDLSGNQETAYDKIRNFDKEINKLSFFLQRVVMKKTMHSNAHGKILFAYSYALEQMGDEILRLWRLMTIKKVVVDDSIIELFKIVRQVLDDSFSLYYRFNNKTLHHLHDLKIDYRKLAFPLFAGDEATSLLLMHLTRLFDSCYDLIHLSLMKEFKPE